MPYADSSRVRVALLAVVGLALLASGGEAEALRHPAAPRCPVFPASNPWNQRVDELPVAADSDAVVRSIGVGDHVHADFGSGLWDGGPIGIPVTVVGRKTPRSRVSFEYASESDRAAYPIPRGVKIEGGPNADDDRHAILLDTDRCRLYELFSLYPRPGGGWRAGSGAIFDLRSNRLRPAGWTSADAAGLPILPGLARYDDVAKGSIDHALRFTARRTRRAYVYPARHFASSDSDPALPPMGLRIRLRRSASLAGLGPQARIVAVALQRYGALLADNGSPWFFCGARTSRSSTPARCRVPDDAAALGGARPRRPARRRARRQRARWVGTRATERRVPELRRCDRGALG